MDFVVRRTCCNDDELMNYGVLGMKWGHRRRSEEYKAFKNAKQTFKKANKAYNKKASTAIGIKRIQATKPLEQKREKAYYDMIDKKAAYKSSTAKNEKQASNREFNVYQKEMSKSGIRGSAADIESGGRSTKLYDHIKIKKGKAYADKIEKRTQNIAIAKFATASVVAIGSAAVSTYLNMK